MKHKNVVFGVIAAGVVATQGMMPVIAHAATSHVTYASTTIHITGQPTLTPQHVVSNDPWTGKPTSWVPIYYLQEALKSVGVKTTWNGSTLDVTSVPSGWSEYTLNEPVKGIAPAGQMQFSIGGNQFEFVRAPKLVTKDPASDAETTYIPVYYANLFLANQLSMSTKWSGTTWNLAPQDITGLGSGSKTATEEDYKTLLNTVKYSSAEMLQIQNVAQQQGVKVYIPSKMGGPSGWYVPGSPQGSEHVAVIPFEDMSFYESSSWNNLIQSSYFTSSNTKLTLDKGGSYTLSGGQQGQWYTLKYSDGTMGTLFVFQEGSTWIGIEPNAAKVPIPELVQAVAETLQLI